MKAQPQPALLLTLLAASTPTVAFAEFRSLHVLLPPLSDSLRYSEGYAVPPGYVDVSNLIFSTYEFTPENETESGDGEVADLMKSFYEDDDSGGALRLLELDDTKNTSYTSESSLIDIVLFREPLSCTKSRVQHLTDCDWSSDFGIGLTTFDWGDKKWFQDGRLIIDSDKFQGRNITLEVPPDGEWSYKVGNGRFDLKDEDHHGVEKYALVMANCNTVIGRNLKVSGEYIVKSAHGYLPWNLFGEMYFFSVLTICCIALTTWYGTRMNNRGIEMIPIEKWVLATIAIVLLASFFKSVDLWVWNANGNRVQFYLYTAVVLCSIKAAITRCLLIMLCKGWGLNCGTLRDKVMVAAFGAMYTVVCTTRDVLTVFDIMSENEFFSLQTEAGLDLIRLFIDLNFYIWCCFALGRTLQNLKDMSQNQKLKRYYGVRAILVFWPVFDNGGSPLFATLLENEHIPWVAGAVDAASYFFVLVGLSCLWAPGVGAKEYAPVIELSSDQGALGVDGERASSGLESHLPEQPEII